MEDPTLYNPNKTTTITLTSLQTGHVRFCSFRFDHLSNGVLHEHGHRSDRPRGTYLKAGEHTYITSDLWITTCTRITNYGSKFWRSLTTGISVLPAVCQLLACNGIHKLLVSNLYFYCEEDFVWKNSPQDSLASVWAALSITYVLALEVTVKGSQQGWNSKVHLQTLSLHYSHSH